MTINFFDEAKEEHLIHKVIYASIKHYKYTYSTSYNEYYKEKSPLANFIGQGAEPPHYDKTEYFCILLLIN